MKASLPALLLGLGLMLAACTDIPRPGGRTTPEENPDPGLLSPQRDRVTGSVTGTTLPGGRVYLASLAEVNRENRGTFTAPDRLDLTLGQPPRGAGQGSLIRSNTPGCVFLGSASGDPVINRFSRLAVEDTEGRRLGTVTEQIAAGGTLEGSVVARLYSSGAASIQGALRCPDASGEYRLNLLPGWNAVEYAVIGGTLFLRDLSPAARTRLVAEAVPAGVGMIADDPGLLRFESRSATLPVRFIPRGGVQGTLTLETDQPEVTVSPRTVTLGGDGGEVRAELTFAFTGEQMPSSVMLTVRDGGGNVVGRLPVSVLDLRPSFMLYEETGPRVLLAGEAQPLFLRAYPIADLSEPVTLTLLDPPAGFSAPATPVVPQVGEPVSFPVTVAADVAPGAYSLAVQGRAGDIVRTLKLTVVVEPPRTALGPGRVLSLALHPGGDLWGVQNRAFVQIREGQVIRRVPLPGTPDAVRVQVGPDGSVWGRGGGRLYRVAEDGAQEFVHGGSDMGAVQSFALDRLGRAWVMAFDGFHAPTLRRTDPVSGRTEAVPLPTGANANVPVFGDAAGNFVLFPDAEGRLVRISVADDSRATSEKLFSPAEREAIEEVYHARDGGLWLLVRQATPTLLRLNPQTLQVAERHSLSGDAAVCASPSAKRVIESASAVWCADSTWLWRVNLPTREAVRVNAQPVNIHDLALAPGQGVAYTFAAAGDWSDTATEYLRLVR